MATSIPFVDLAHLFPSDLMLLIAFVIKTEVVSLKSPRSISFSSPFTIKCFRRIPLVSPIRPLIKAYLLSNDSPSQNPLLLSQQWLSLE